MNPLEDVVVTIPDGFVVGSFNFSVANASITFRGGSITANSITMDGAQNGKNLVLEECVFKSALTNPDQINRLVLTDEARLKFAGEIRIGTLTLGNRTIFHNLWGRYGNTATIDTFELGVELTKFKPGKAIVGKMKTLNDLSAVWIKSDGNFTVTDSSSVALVGGTDTLASGTSQIPIAVNFVGVNNDDDAFKNASHSAMTLDADGKIKPVSMDTFTREFTAAGELDNVYINADVTLDADKTVNALYVGNQSKVDLNGHTLTIRSGFFRVEWNCNVFRRNTRSSAPRTRSPVGSTA